MAEPNILLTRIDNRLIHGQVATQWNSTLGSNLAEGKRQVATTVAVNDDDVECFRKLQEHGVELSIQRVPSTPVEDTNKLFA